MQKPVEVKHQSPLEKEPRKTVKQTGEQDPVFPTETQPSSTTLTHQTPRQVTKVSSISMEPRPLSGHNTILRERVCRRPKCTTF